MFGSNYNTCIVSLGTESIGRMKWQTDSQVSLMVFLKYFF